MGPFTPIFIESKLSGHSDHNHKWNRRAISLWCTQSWRKSKRAQNICGLTQQRTVFALGYSSWTYWFLKQLTHGSSWSIYSSYQYMFRQWQFKIRTALAFTVVKILERIKNYHTNFRQNSWINKHPIKSEFITFRMRAGMKGKCVELMCKGEIWPVSTTGIWSWLFHCFEQTWVRITIRRILSLKHKIVFSMAQAWNPKVQQANKRYKVEVWGDI